jgi:hypothetical protein
MDLNKALEELNRFLNTHTEILLIDEIGKAFSLKNGEIETQIERDRILISFLDDKGFQTWRVAALSSENSEILLDLSRNFSAETQKIRIVPRVSAEELSAEIEIARIERANQVAHLLVAEFERSKLIRVQLNKENGRFAQIIFERDRIQIAVLTDVSETVSPEVYLSNAIIWLSKLERRKNNPVFEIWILAERKKARNLQKLHALLSDSWKQKISIFDLNEESEMEKLIRRKRLSINDLWREKPGKLTLIEKQNQTQTAKEIIKFALEKIDCISMKSGESLRFHGLKFARVRRVFDAEKSWFGIERDRRILSERSFEDFEKMIADLEIYRSFDSRNKRHEFYRMSPEAWLESILRRNIKLLDANLILSPIYNQFRASNDKIDLLALRKDGRLVIIELKVAPDREMIFQGADYWRKVELQRRKGVLSKAKIFGEFEIADAPTIVYLAAPTLSFHQNFRFFAKTISSEIEIYRFDLAENWRESLKVLRREKLVLKSQ